MLIRYIAAKIYDAFILLALFFAFTALCLIGNHGEAISSGTRWYQIGLLTITFIYYILSIRFGGQTIGMRSWRLQIIADNGAIQYQQIVGRILLFLPSLFIAVIRFKTPQDLLDLWTKTRLITPSRKSI